MTPKLFGLPLLLVTCMLPFSTLQADEQGQNVTLNENLQIPGANLKPGTYNFSVEDRLADRAIVRISDAQDANEHYLLLAVPNSKLAATGSNHLLYFKSGSNGRQALRAWKCASCAATLEFVYAKLEAVKITDDSTEPVLAVDPASDKLPSNLSADDMKVVTLWLLSPERITPDNVGQGVKAAKYSPEPNQAKQEQAAQNTNPAAAPTVPAIPATPPAAPTNLATGPAPAQSPVETASLATDSSAARSLAGRRRLPKTASNTYLFGVCGLISLAAAFALRMKRRKL